MTLKESVQVTDAWCQATEEDIALCLAGPSEGRGILSSVLEEQEVTTEQQRLLKLYQNWHFQESTPPSPPPIDLTDFALVCEEVSTTGDHEEFFNKKFDQLEKLHELYKSVSSISAKSQSRLQLNRTKASEEIDNKNLLSNHQRSASFSLTGLLGDLDNISIPSSVSDDLNSLCSEPAWVSRQGTAYLDINRNTSLTSVSLSSLLPPTDNDSASVAFSAAETEEVVRSHSPVLEGMDSQLAKYAQLKDLEVEYRPPPMGNQDSAPILEDLSPTRASQQLSPSVHCRRPDGASDPDSDPSPPSKRSIGAATLPRRSPGTGRSSSSSEVDDSTVGQKAGSRGPPADCGGIPPQATSGTQADNIVHPKLPEKKLDPDKEVKTAEKEKSRMIPRFSRLFGGMRRISRSPSQIAGKGNEDKIRSKASKRQTKTSQISLGDSSPLRIEKVIPEKASKSKHKFFSSKDKCSSKSPIHVTSKNVKGTLSSGWWSSSRVFMLLCIPTQIAQTSQHFLFPQSRHVIARRMV